MKYCNPEKNISQELVTWMGELPFLSPQVKRGRGGLSFPPLSKRGTEVGYLQSSYHDNNNILLWFLEQGVRTPL
jgi:hypothetical protein